jgi:hypothetical protein
MLCKIRREREKLFRIFELMICMRVIRGRGGAREGVWAKFVDFSSAYQWIACVMRYQGAVVRFNVIIRAFIEGVKGRWALNGFFLGFF